MLPLAHSPLPSGSVFCMNESTLPVPRLVSQTPGSPADAVPAPTNGSVRRLNAKASATRSRAHRPDSDALEPRRLSSWLAMIPPRNRSGQPPVSGAKGDATDRRRYTECTDVAEMFVHPPRPPKVANQTKVGFAGRRWFPGV